MKVEKKIDDWVRQGLELELQGHAPGSIGHAAGPGRLRAWRRKIETYRRLVLRAGKSDLRISIVNKPEFAGDRVRLGMILDLPIEGDPLALSGKATHALEAFLQGAVGAARKSPPRVRKVRTIKSRRDRRGISAV